MSHRFLPVRPDLDQIRNQAKDLLRAIRAGEAEALAELHEFHPEKPDPATVKLADAQLTLARAYENPSWPRLIAACKMSEAIWQDDIETVRQLVLANPNLLHEQTSGRPHSNWGPPMSYAANLGRNEIVEMLRALGAEDVQKAFGRACLQGKLDTARRLFAMGAKLGPGAVMGPCETLSGSGLEFVLELGAKFEDGHGDRMAPIGLILETYSRNPAGKHRCLELAVEHGYEFPDTAAMAVHRGRIDLLEAAVRREPGVVQRILSMEEMFPLELGCHEDRRLALCGTPLYGATLLHMAVEYDEIEMVRWLLENGADVNVRAGVDSDGFGGQTALFGCVVSLAYLCGRQRDGALARVLLDAGADVNVRVSMRKELIDADVDGMHEFRGVTALSWGERFQDQKFVNKGVMKVIEEHGGVA